MNASGRDERLSAPLCSETANVWHFCFPGSVAKSYSIFCWLPCTAAIWLHISICTALNKSDCHFFFSVLPWQGWGMLRATQVVLFCSPVLALILLLRLVDYLDKRQSYLSWYMLARPGILSMMHYLILLGFVQFASQSALVTEDDRQAMLVPR